MSTEAAAVDSAGGPVVKKKTKRKKSTMMFRQMQLMKTEQMRLNSLRQTKSKI